MIIDQPIPSQTSVWTEKIGTQNRLIGICCRAHQELHNDTSLSRRMVWKCFHHLQVNWVCCRARQELYNDTQFTWAGWTWKEENSTSFPSFKSEGEARTMLHLFFIFVSFVCISLNAYKVNENLEFGPGWKHRWPTNKNESMIFVSGWKGSHS